MTDSDLIPSGYRDAKSEPTIERISVSDLHADHAVFDNSMVTIYREAGVFHVRSGEFVIGKLETGFAPKLTEGFDRWGVDELPGRFSLEGGPHVSTDLFSYAERKGRDLRKEGGST
jgi:hypothetical protein